MVEPILKWAGGKRWLVAKHSLPQPERYARYVEPFMGSGAVYFHLKPSVALLSDANAELINLYVSIRDFPEEVERILARHQNLHSADHYYEVRAEVPKCNVAAAARFLYLNRTCWNGLYRVNRKGEFNVPIGTKQTVCLPTDDFKTVSRMLRGSELVCCDFEDTIERCGEGDYLFVDPPYTVKHNFNGFVKYNEKIFSWDDQVRLHDCLISAANRGASIVVTNADHPTIRDLYEDDFVYSSIARHSVLSGKASGRKATTEALFSLNV